MRVLLCDHLKFARFIILVVSLFELGSNSAFGQQPSAKEPTKYGNPVDMPETKKKETKAKRYALFPVVVKSPEYLWGAGAAGTYYFKLGHDTTVRSSNIKAVSFYTLRKQLVVGTETTVYFPSEAYILHINASYSHFPDRFWGIGNTTPSSNQESYAITQFSTTPQLSRVLFSDFYLGVGYDFQNVFDFDYNSQGGESLFDQENVPGRKGGRISGPQLLLTYDSRNNAFSPSGGFYVQYLIDHYNSALGSNFTFTVQSIDMRKFFALKKDRVIAMQLNIITNHGNVPVRSLASMGSSSYMRGYYDGRYADKNLIAYQTEYRTPVYKRFGIVVFAGVGRVGDTFDDLWSISHLKPSLGFGLRYSLSPKEKLNLRLDAGWGKQSQGTYINLGEAF